MIEIEFSKNVSTPNVYSAYDKLLKRQDLGFLKILERDHLWQSSLERAVQIRAQAQQFLFIGIGGSSLGVRALLAACPHQRDEFLILENVDEDTYTQTLKLIKDFSQLHVVVTSKSGGTLETLALLEFLSLEFKSRGLKIEQQTTVISELGPNALGDWARAHHIPILEIPVDVGGRFSVLSPVGFLPAALSLKSLDEIKSGIQWAFQQRNMIEKLVTQSLASFERKEWITVLWHYGDRLNDCGLWWQQLWAESLAKVKTVDNKTPLRVSTPLVVRGAQDQHSLLQQFMEGAKDKWFWFFQLSEPSKLKPLSAQEIASPWKLKNKSLADVMQAEMQATKEALEEQKIATAQFRFDEFTPRAVAGYFMLMQLVVGTLGEFLEINAYNQPGVEFGKIRAREILAKGVAV